jgi:regulator of protease activity HflC (stomatin/prohibitin superfamily)
MRSDPKCIFLLEEYTRIKKDGDAFAEASGVGHITSVTQLEGIGANTQDLAAYVAGSEEYAAQLTVLSMKSSSCQRGEALSSLDRLPFLEIVRQKHISRAKSRWEGLGGTSEDAQSKTIVDRINAIYDAEAKSYYNSDSVREELDPDIIKDYPTLLVLIRNSSLPEEHKRFLEQNSRHIRYEEAGRLHNILKGLDPNGSLGYAYTLRKALADRAKEANRAAELKTATQFTAATAGASEGGPMWVWIVGALLLTVAGGALVFFNGKRYAKYKAIRTGALRMRYWWGMKELILWDPGEAVVLLRDKKLVAMADATGGYTDISALRGEEYKGRITYKSQFMTWTSDPIYTSDGVLVNLALDIWWLIQNPNQYIARISADYHAGDKHYGEPRTYTDTPTGEKEFDRKLTETAEKWIRSLAGSTLREHVCQLTAAKLISPYVQSYIHRYFQAGAGDSEQYQNRLPTLLKEALAALDAKTQEYGIHIERLEVRELKLPQNVQEKLEGVRVTFLEAPQSQAQTEAGAIAIKGLGAAQVAALEGLVSVIGENRVGQIELLKAFGMAKIPFVAPHAPALSLVQPITSVYQDSVQGIIPGPTDAAAGTPTKIADTAQEGAEPPESEQPKAKGTGAGGS